MVKKIKAVKMCKKGCKTKAKKTSGMIQGTSKLSQRDAYQKFLNMPKTRNAKSSGAGWGGEAPIKKKKGASTRKIVKKAKSKGMKPPVMANGRMKTNTMPIKVM